MSKYQFAPLLSIETTWVGKLSCTQVTIQLADRSVKVSKREVTDVLFQIGEFIYPVDFIVLETKQVSNPMSPTFVILGYLIGHIYCIYIITLPCLLSNKSYL